MLITIKRPLIVSLESKMGSKDCSFIFQMGKVRLAFSQTTPPTVVPLSKALDAQTAALGDSVQTPLCRLLTRVRVSDCVALRTGSTEEETCQTGCYD